MLDGYFMSTFRFIWQSADYFIFAGKNWLRVIAGLALSLSLAISAVAEPGDLDTTFDLDGKVTTSIGAFDYGQGVAIQSDGKLVVVGYGPNSTDGDFAIVRYNTNGSLDTSFDSDGKLMTDFGGGEDEAYGVAVQLDGKIVVAGKTSNSGATDFALARYNADGSLDTSFDFDGKVTTPVGSGNESAYALAIQADGKLVAAGYVYTGTSNDFAVVRYNVDGSLDSSFDTDGIATTDLNSVSFDIAESLALQPNGKIILVGYSHPASDANDDFAIARYNSNGSLDASFDSDGIVITPIGSADDIGRAVALQPNGKIVVVGGRDDGSGNNDFAIARYNLNGSMDTAFDTDGIVTTAIGSGDDEALAVALQFNGKLVVAGTGFIGLFNDFAVARYNNDGSLDTTFSNDGIVTTAIGSFADWANALAIQPDGKIVAAGWNGSPSDITVVRYHGDTPPPPPNADFDFDGDGKADIAVFRPDAFAVWYLLLSGSGNSFAATQWGLATDKPTPADFDGDHKTDYAVFRDGTWYILLSTTSALSAQSFGQAGDLPVTGDYDGDGKADVAVFRPTDGIWYILNSGNNQFRAEHFGVATDKPIVGDFDGDGLNDLAVYRDGIWYLQRSQEGFIAVQFGTATSRPVAADYDGDGETDIAVFLNGTWYLQRSSAGNQVVPFGLATDIPAPADYDGDDKSDVAVFRDGVWYVIRSTNGAFVTTPFGQAGDTPVPSAYLP